MIFSSSRCCNSLAQRVSVGLLLTLPLAFRALCYFYLQLFGVV
jgi:hypothetical protein